jgi:acyl-homoserine lactone acylase PvdQ
MPCEEVSLLRSAAQHARLVLVVLLALVAVPDVAVAAARPPAGPALTVPGAGAVRIVRDQYGVPHVYAATSRALFYGEGYAVGQDRLWQGELLRRTGTGTISEMPRVGGPGSVPGDLSFREYTEGRPTCVSCCTSCHHGHGSRCRRSVLG